MDSMNAAQAVVAGIGIAGLSIGMLLAIILTFDAALTAFINKRKDLK